MGVMLGGWKVGGWSPPSILILLCALYIDPVFCKQCFGCYICYINGELRSSSNSISLQVAGGDSKPCLAVD